MHSALICFGILQPSLAQAQETETVCEDSRIRIQGRLGEQWLEPLVHACETLRALPDSDATARVRIVPAGRDVIVEVALRDGRATLRRVHNPAALTDTLEALLMIPPSHVPPDARWTKLAVTPAQSELVPPAPLQPVPVAGQTIGVELGGSVGGRVAGDGYFSITPAGFAQIRANDWLFGMSARWDVYQMKRAVHLTDFDMQTIAAGLAVARRLRVGFGNLDIGLSPRLLAETQGYTTTLGEQADSQIDVRLAAFARAALGRSHTRVFIEIDAELSPSRIRRSIHIDATLPPLPAWSAGASFGLIWGQP